VIFDKYKPVYKFNLKKELKNKKEEIVRDILKAKHEAGAPPYRIKQREFANFEVFTKYNDYLYDLFIKKSEKLLNPFTLKNTPLKVWCYFTGLGNHVEDTWHNHTRTSNINSVIYLETVKDYGINFKTDKESWYIEPKNFDLLIFPGFLSHKPVTSNIQQRISLNLELKCNEEDKDIFGL
tara:strand:- start:135 stop:674 length:540 start_codon:yes stop_codon:yes gene_type:complete